MSKIKGLVPIIENAKHLAESLLGKKPSQRNGFPDTAGVYLIYDKDGNVIYVGKAKKLRRRINDDHVSGERKISTSTFRRKVYREYGIEPGNEMRTWVINNCLFAYEEIENSDTRSLVETLLIAFLRANSEPLLND